MSIVNTARTRFKTGLGMVTLACCFGAVLTSCQSGAITALEQAQTFWSPEALQAHGLQVALLGSPHPTDPAAGTVGVNLKIGETYRIQDNQPGQQAAVLADIMALRVFLVDASTGLPTGAVSPYPSSTDVFTLSTVSTDQNILFTQVPTGTYAVCVAAFNNSIGPFSESTNISSLESQATYTEGPAQCSNSGGNGDGSVSVGAAPSYTVSNPAPLNISLNLKSATGASIELNATVTDG